MMKNDASGEVKMMQMMRCHERDELILFKGPSSGSRFTARKRDVLMAKIEG